MALADLAQARTVPAHTCSVCWIATQLGTDDATALEACLLNPAVKFSDIAAELYVLGWRVPAISISRHARGGCSACRKYRA